MALVEHFSARITGIVEAGIIFKKSRRVFVEHSSSPSLARIQVAMQLVQ
jgi:hypothetical protein